MIIDVPFESYPKIENIKKIYMSVTQKIHGTNGQIYITCNGKDYNIYAGSRNRWLSLNNDNAGFARFVHDNRHEIVNLLGEGRHFGEWAGEGINTGEGMKEKKFFLFDWRRWQKMPLPKGIDSVPVLYTGDWSRQQLEAIMQDLKLNGSRIVPGYMKPEGIVINLAGKLYKKVFDEEEVQWAKPDVTKANLPEIDCIFLLQPLRLKKILGRDEEYLRNYPSNIQEIVRLYYQDLIDEKVITEEEMKERAIRKSFGRSVFPFVKSVIQELENER